MTPTVAPRDVYRFARAERMVHRATAILMLVCIVTGATFVHDWFALAVGLLVLGHIFFALNDVEARRGMRTGWVTAAWAREQHAAWADEIDPDGKTSD